VPGLTAKVIEAAKATGAAVMIPGNVYVFGRDMPELLTPDTPMRRPIRSGASGVELEAAYRASGVKTVILRAGDFLDTEASGNWFDRIIAARVGKGKLSYPGPLDRIHAWAYLPDLAEAFAGLADRLEDLPQFLELTFPGYALTRGGACRGLRGGAGPEPFGQDDVMVADPGRAALLGGGEASSGNALPVGQTPCAGWIGARPGAADPAPDARGRGHARGCWRRLSARRPDRPRSAGGPKRPRPFRQ
jgi:hypothetical protein